MPWSVLIFSIQVWAFVKLLWVKMFYVKLWMMMNWRDGELSRTMPLLERMWIIIIVLRLIVPILCFVGLSWMIMIMLGEIIMMTMTSEFSRRFRFQEFATASNADEPPVYPVEYLHSISIKRVNSIKNCKN